MAYPKLPDLRGLVDQIGHYVRLKHEYGAGGAEPILRNARDSLQAALTQIKALAIDRELASREPDSLQAIRKLRPKGVRRIWDAFRAKEYAERLEGALLGRMAGCILGAPVEFWSIEEMRRLAEQNGDDFPPTDYWTSIPRPWALRYQMSPCSSYTRGGMDGVPVDDDLTYTLLGLLIVEEYGPDFTTEDVGKAWLKRLPLACTAEAVALDNLRKGVPAAKAAGKGNPYCEWIGADIRSDPWGYMAPGWPEKAAELAYRDAFISHRRQGIYGEMFFSAAIAAAFAVDSAEEALQVGLTEIPADCALARAVRWALRSAPNVKDYSQARAAVDKKFKGMSGVHTINNAVLTVWGLTIGGRDFTRVIGETVAMGMDNDCTAATAGSLAGALVGKRGIPEHWHRRFNNTILTYMIARRKPGRRFSIDGILGRFARQARKVWAGA